MGQIRHKLIADAMFGKLGRFLRLLGVDTEIADPQWTDTQILEHAQKAQRVILTRDVEFFYRTENQFLAGGPQPRNLGVYLPSQDLQENLSAVFAHFEVSPTEYLWTPADEKRAGSIDNLDKEPILPFVARCTQCNSPVKKISREIAQDLVPKGTFELHTTFWQCENDNCNKVYWIGRHWDDVRQIVADIAQKDSF